MITFTDQWLATLKAPSKGAKEYRESTGLVLRVSQGGSKVFYFVKQANGKRHCVRLGEYPSLTVDKARNAYHAAQMAHYLVKLKQKEAIHA